MEKSATLLQAISLGLVQGVAEFLPISSSAHLQLVRSWFDLPMASLLFDLLLHLATLVVILLYYRRFLWDLICSFFRFFGGKSTEHDQKNIHYILALLVATGATVIVALLLRKGGFDVYSKRRMGFLMVATALILLSTRFIPQGGEKSNITFVTALVTGLIQGLGTLQGLSRSGSVFSATRWAKVEKEEAARFTYILSIPAVLGALVLTLFEKTPAESGPLFSNFSIVVATLVAFLAGLGTLRFFLWVVKKEKLWYFSLYVAMVGIALLLN